MAFMQDKCLHKRWEHRAIGEHMPNICSNHVKIMGDRATLDRLIAAQLGMDELVPAPAGME